MNKQIKKQLTQTEKHIILKWFAKKLTSKGYKNVFIQFLPIYGVKINEVFYSLENIIKLMNETNKITYKFEE